MAKLVTGIFKNRSSSMLAVEDLLRHGYPQEDISVAMTDGSNGREFFMDMASKAPEGATVGGLLGGAICAALAALVSTGNIADPGLGLAAVSPTISTLAGFGAGSLGGLLLGALFGSSIPEYEANMFSLDHKKHGGILVGVYCHEKRCAEAHKVLDAAGGMHIRNKNVRTESLRYQNMREYTEVGAGDRLLDRPVDRDY